jgi:hypothetical protein
MNAYDDQDDETHPSTEGPLEKPRRPWEPRKPTQRLLRGYSFDPSLATRLDTSLVSEITYRVRWEKLDPGPVGEYVEVVDIDPASGCLYAPVDLDHAHVLAQNGLEPSEGNPQFHQQMVYAVAMTTIDRFERALGRPAFWRDRFDRDKPPTSSARNQYVQRLRIYPHALRMPNAYYSPERIALLFGYFPATADRTSGEFPSGLVFTCLSHDIIAHETAHALLDGFHHYLLEPTNADVLAFHEAFSDVVALFQHFSFPEVLTHQIAKTRGDLSSENLLAQLATQFGHARGSHGALRDAIGHFDQKQRRWVRHQPDPTALDRTMEVHERGAILVAAIFDAFVSIYRNRSADLLRIATGGTGILPQGELGSDLVTRLAQEAAKSASHVLNMCIRALDYCPPVDLTFGEFLRALITADMDLMRYDEHRYRVAFIEAFRRRGIFPSDLRTLSEESLRWAPPWQAPDSDPEQIKTELENFIRQTQMKERIDALRYAKGRAEIWRMTRVQRRVLWKSIRNYLPKAELMQRITGLNLTGDHDAENVNFDSNGDPVFSVYSFREARRVRDDGRALNQVFFTLLQKETRTIDGRTMTLRCGSTVVVDLDEARITYVIRKGLQDDRRFERTAKFMDNSPAMARLAGTYFTERDETFAALHHVGA